MEKLLCDVFTSEMITPVIAHPTILFSSDQELIERAKVAKNGDRFARLWAGDTSDFCWRSQPCGPRFVSHPVVLVQG